MSAEKVALNFEEVGLEHPSAVRLRDLLNKELLARYTKGDEPTLPAAARSALSVPTENFVANVLVVTASGHAISMGRFAC